MFESKSMILPMLRWLMPSIKHHETNRFGDGGSYCLALTDSSYIPMIVKLFPVKSYHLPSGKLT